MRTLRPHIFLLALAVVGAGCQPKLPGTSSTGPGRQVSSQMGFGKLPGLDGDGRQAGGYTGMDAKMAAGNVAAPTMMMAEDAVGGGTAGMPMTAPSAMGRAVEASELSVRALPPPPDRMTPAVYQLKASLPEWETQGDVLATIPNIPNAQAAATLASNAGLPGQVVSTMSSVTSMSAQWQDATGGQWNFDAGSRYLSYWKDMMMEKQPETRPKLDEAAIVAAADTFLTSHGFEAIKQRGGKVMDLPQIMPLIEEAQNAERSSMPCIMMKGTEATMGAGVATPIMANAPVAAAVAPSAQMEPGMVTDSQTMPIDADAKISPMIYPSPCGWWPQVTVMYAGTKEGKAVSDPYGNDADVVSVTVNLSTLQVTGFNAQLDSSTNRSSYPLISKEVAEDRLKHGGRNPMMYWGDSNGRTTVTIETVELVWMRYDSWNQSRQETYYLPALRAKGTVTNTSWGDPQEYRTVVPLVADEAFE